MGGHARFSPSSGKRRLECPPSLLLEEQFPDEESPFAAEGSAGHAMAEYLINKYLKKRTKRPVLFIAKVKYRKLQPPFVGNCRINGWGKCRF